MDVGQFVFNHILRHVETFRIEIPICFPRLLYGIMLAQHSSVITEHDAPVLAAKTHSQLSIVSRIS